MALLPNEPALREIQSMILKPHGRHFVRCLFLTFGNDAKTTFEWLNYLAKTKITSAYQQEEQSIKYKEFGSKALLLCGLYLSWDGYTKLGLTPPSDTHFRNGMKLHADKSNVFPTSEKWELPFQEKLCGMVLLAGNDEVQIDIEINKIKASFIQTGSNAKAFIQNGKRLFSQMDGKKVSVEPFGFKDGISQPRFFRDKVPLRNRWPIILDKNKGSYLVFMKLKQDVSAFNQAIHELAGKLGISESLAGAQVFGRFKDGCPLHLYSDPSEVKTDEDREKIQRFDEFSLYSSVFDEVDFYNDPNGNRCPLHAHIRQTNPRQREHIKRRDEYGGHNDKLKEYPVIITRRSIPYEEVEETGLLFMSFQAQSDQFVAMQEKWASNTGFLPGEPISPLPPPNKAGLDPLIGRMSIGIKNPGQEWNKGWDTDKRETFDFPQVVYFRGGEYFYAPSIGNLKEITIYSSALTRNKSN